MRDAKISLSALEYEEFVAESFRALLDAHIGHVRRNRHIKGKKSGHDHQFDIVIELSLLGIDFLVIVECKKYRRRINISEALEFASRLDDVSAHKGVMVTTVGYQKGSVRVAEAHRIALIVTAPRAPRWMSILGFYPHIPTAADRLEELEASRIHATIRLCTSDEDVWGYYDFQAAWGLVVFDLARGLIQEEIRQGNIVFQLCCQACDRPLGDTQFVRGKCPRCANEMSEDRFEGGVWYRCDCGKMLHRSDLVVEVAPCECGKITPASSFQAIRETKLEKLYAQLNVHTARRHRLLDPPPLH